MREKICFIVGAGEHYQNSFHLTENDMVIAADAGYSFCKARGIKPNVVIGDFDSLKEIPVGEN
ncbi:MAG: thiamine pyrophosphokinase, partial [Firmicutes bacterium]|nr:thiamine pyrophosphokinase [Bacillota bacterium]